MGMTYDELSVFGRLRKIQRHGPYSMARHLIALWGPGTEKNLPIEEIARKVKYFFKKGTQGERKHTPYITPFKYGSHEIHTPNITPNKNR